MEDFGLTSRSDHSGGFETPASRFFSGQEETSQPRKVVPVSWIETWFRRRVQVVKTGPTPVLRKPGKANGRKRLFRAFSRVVLEKTRRSVFEALQQGIFYAQPQGGSGRFPVRQAVEWCSRNGEGAIEDGAKILVQFMKAMKPWAFAQPPA